jgi:Transposase DDE domain
MPATSSGHSIRLRLTEPWASLGTALCPAEAADQADVPDGMSIPEELERRKVRLEKLAAARSTIEARAKERFEREQSEHQAKIEAREVKIEATGKKPGGKPPQPPPEGPLPTDQVNLTDEESRIMPVPHSDTLGVRQPNAKEAGGGFEQCYNAQAVVAADSLLVVAVDVVQAANDKQQLQPMLNQVIALSDALGKTETLLADNGYFSAANVSACEAVAVQPLIAMGREAHHPSLNERFADAPPQPKDPTTVEAIAYRLATLEGKTLYLRWAAFTWQNGKAFEGGHSRLR